MNQIEQLHSQLIVHGLLGETITVAKVVAFCSLSGAGDLIHGRKVFDALPKRNRFMWNCIIRGFSMKDHRETLVLHRRMLSAGFTPNGFTLPFVLKSCATGSASSETQMVHSLIFKLGFESQVFVMNALVHAYTMCGSVERARKVFDEIPQRNIVSWNSMINGYSQLGNLREAFGLFKVMRDSGLKPDGFTFVTLLSVCSQTGNLKFGLLVHHLIIVAGVDTCLIMGNALVDMYGKCRELNAATSCFESMPKKNVVTWTSMVCALAKHGMIDRARCLFDEMPNKSLISWNAMLSSYVQCSRCRESLLLFQQMINSGVIPDDASLVTVLSVCSQIGDLIIGKQVHDYISANIVNPSVTLYNAIIDMYAKCGLLNIALQLFSSTLTKSVVSWNVIIGAAAMHGHANAAIDHFEQMVAAGFPPDGITFTGLLSACSHAGLLEIGEHYFNTMNHVYKVPYEIEHYACMVHLYGRGGQLKEAVKLIRSMPMKPDVVVWGALLGACRIHGNVRIGNKILKHLLEMEQCNAGTYVLMSNIYSEARRWEDMKKLRKLMKIKGIKKDAGISLIEINGVVNEFLVDDMRHERAEEIYISLDRLTHHLMSTKAYISEHIT
ncbi:Tetratricopeptide-like helical domain-containing protein [Dioscorea alata]|uniref:Tetratricopeptide-like helical domain-containing protein n=1 Tax=Dioscorea alata TaxID=55571 RepID=A0ACB7WUN5_DIOAL|nr:Tetratricopeptide-like helical domain-containing protein [Dioscorea alata]